MTINNNFINMIEEQNNYTYTENGAVALNSTLNLCLDMFSSFATMSMNHCFSDESIIDCFKNAFFEDRKTAMRMLFYFRDIRGGQGVRRSFRVALKWLADNYSDYVINNLNNVFEFGRCDDILCLLDTDVCDSVIKLIVNTLRSDLEKCNNNEPCSLLAKWLPSENASSKETRRYARIIINKSGFSPKQYRKILSKLRNYLNITECKISSNKWDTIDYNSVPGKASIKYSDAFFNHDKDRYVDYVSNLDNNKVHADTLYPVDIVSKIIDRKVSKPNEYLYDALWKNLPDYFEGKDETGLCVVDVSGSMAGLPIAVAISLGLYCADKCKGPFKNKFITFSSNPKINSVVDGTIKDKVVALGQAEWGYGTNIEAVFDLILTTAINNNCKQEELPNKLYIITDMQFNVAAGNNTDCTIINHIKKKFKRVGYEMPALVYWNVEQSNCGMYQDTALGDNCCMVGGYSASLFKAVLDGTQYVVDETTHEVKQKLDPLTVMNNTINNSRYDVVWCE